MARAMKADIKDCYAKWLLVCLADHADEERHRCWPSLERLAERSSMNRVTVTRKLNYLEQNGYLTRKRGNSIKSTVYTIFPSVPEKLVAECNKVVAESNTNLSPKPINKNESLDKWKPDDTLIESINEKGELNHDNETTQFINYHLAKGTKFKDISRGYRYWCNNRLKWDAESKSNSKINRGKQSNSYRQKSSFFGGVVDQIKSQ